jgi:general secretion pathway protein C
MVFAARRWWCARLQLHRRLDDNRRMSARWFAFVIWAAVAATVAAWGLRLSATPPAVPVYTVPVAESGALRGDVLRLLGRDAQPARSAPAAPVVASEAGRFKLLGVVAPRDERYSAAGLALIAIDDKPARPVRVGGNVGDGLVLLGVHRRGASLGPQDGAPTVSLELPERPPPSTGKVALPPMRAPAPTPPAVAAPVPAEAIVPPQRAAVPAPVPEGAQPQEAASAPEQ